MPRDSRVGPWREAAETLRENGLIERTENISIRVSAPSDWFTVFPKDHQEMKHWLLNGWYKLTGSEWGNNLFLMRLNWQWEFLYSHVIEVSPLSGSKEWTEVTGSAAVRLQILSASRQISSSLAESKKERKRNTNSFGVVCNGVWLNVWVSVHSQSARLYVRYAVTGWRSEGLM